MSVRCECGLTYAPGIPDDEVLHRHIHSEYATGPHVRELQHLAKVGLVENLTVKCVDSGTPSKVARKVAHVAMVAQREIPGMAGFYGDGSGDQRLYVLEEEDRCVGMVFVANAMAYWRLAWNDSRPGRIELVDRAAVVETLPVIARVWIAADYRSRGLARGLLLFAIANCAATTATVCWELPFTAGGEALVRSLLPKSFRGSCDAYQMGQVLAGNTNS